MINSLAGRVTKPDARQESAADAMQRISKLGMSPRQQELNHLWAWYRCQNYAARRVDWNGREVSDAIEHEAIASAGFIPPGFYDAGATFPLKFRRPTAPYRMVKVIVDRFTGLLFSERHNPRIICEGDTDTEDYVTALAEASRLWPAMILARTYGGAMGTVAVGFQFIDGRPSVEVHDPRWTTPDFKDRQNLILRGIDKRYMYPVEEKNPENGEYEAVWYWYRRTIDEQSDVLYEPVLVGDGNEPEWVEQSRVEHNLGFCPVIWVQNLPVQDDIDGDSDCVGVYDMIEAVDALLAQANKGVISNSDPTLNIVTDADMSEVQKGSDNALKLPAGSSAGYLEISGSGPTSAMSLADKFRQLILEVAQCVLDHPDMSQRTATEIERVYSSMIMKADVMREQYGEKMIRPLMEMMLVSARTITEPRVNSDSGAIERGTITLPPRVMKGADGSVTRVERKPGMGESVFLKWPPYFAPMLADVELATRSAATANAAGLLDVEHAVKYIADFFEIDDVAEVLKKVAAEKEKRDAQAEEAAMMAIQNHPTPPPPPQPMPEPGTEPNSEPEPEGEE